MTPQYRAQPDSLHGQKQQGTGALSPSRPFDVAHAGFGYFADQQHYGSLAGRVLAGLRQGCRIALVTGDPPISPLSLATAFTRATAGKHTVLAIACGDDFSEEQLRCTAGPSLLLLFHQADSLSDGQLSRLCSYLASSGNGPPGVLLGRAGFAARLEKLQLHPFEDGRAIRFNFYELGRDEIDVFIRRQLCPSTAANAHSVDAINWDALSVDGIDWIADVSRGDPAQVNQLTRLILERAGTVDGTGPAGDSTSEQVLPGSALRWRRAMSRLALIGILLCLGMSVQLIVAGGPKFGDRIGAPEESSSDGSLASEQAAASPSAGVAAPNSAEGTLPSSRPVAATASMTVLPTASEPIAQMEGWWRQRGELSNATRKPVLPAQHRRLPDALTSQRDDQAVPEVSQRPDSGFCDYQACSSFYHSFRASDCTYQPYRDGPRQLCEKGKVPSNEADRTFGMPPNGPAPVRCNLNVCARFYMSFNSSDCTYQPYHGGPRQLCDK
jgi:hypothetical protein